ncbi:MAG: hypothetical protein RL398_1420, partial [Planctomycetota bacterium]
MLRTHHRLLSLVAFAAAAAAQGVPVGFEETYALADDRAKAVASLIPGTDEWYYYSARERLDARDYAAVRKLLGPWIQRHNRNVRVLEIEARLTLLDYESDPAAAFTLVRQRMGLTFAHQREARDDRTRSDLPTNLDPALLDAAKLRNEALAAHPGTTAGFTDAALPSLLASDLSADQLRDVLSRLDRADLDNLPGFVVRDLAHPQSGGFGSLRVHGLLFLDQLEACAQLQPNLLGQGKFVQAMLAKLEPESEVDWRTDPELRERQLQRLLAFSRRLAPSFNSLKAHVLHHLLAHRLETDNFDRDLFLSYLALPRRGGATRQAFLEGFRAEDVANLDASFETGLPPIGNDEPLLRACLERLFATEDSITPYSDYLDTDYLRAVLAETKLLLGQGDAQRWYTMRNDPAALERLEKRVEIGFPRHRKTRFAAGDDVTLEVDVKNVPTLLVKIYRIDAFRYLSELQREVDAGIDLDGVVPNHEFTVTSELPPLRRERRSFPLPQLREPGTYVVDFVGNGTNSRAVIRKGALSCAVRTTAAGHAVRIWDETKAHRKDATLWFGGVEYKAGDDGEILLPFTAQPGDKLAVLRTAERASLAEFAHVAESYDLTAAFHLDRESTIAGRKAALVLGPRLTCAGETASLKLLEEPVLTVLATDLDGETTTKEIKLASLADAREHREEIAVPDRLQSVSVTLRGRIKNLRGEPVQLSTPTQTLTFNGIDRLASTKSVLLGRNAEGRYLEVRGKDGELRAGVACEITLQHRDFRNPIRTTLATDANGRIRLGDLPGITFLNAACRDHAVSMSLDTAKASLPRVLRVAAESPIRLPYPGGASTLLRRDCSLTADAQDHFDKLALNDGALEIRALPPGVYTLRLHETGQTVIIDAMRGTAEGTWLVGDAWTAKRGDEESLRLPKPTVDDDSVTVQVLGASPGTRVHVLATRYEPPQTLLQSLMPPARPPAQSFDRSHRPSQYEAGRTIGDEYRYVLERRFAQKFPGNMLPRPSLLVNPWRLDERSRNEAVGMAKQKGGAFRSQAPAPEAGAQDARRGAMFGGPATAAAPGSSTPNLDFLPNSAPVYVNLVPDDRGTIRIPRAALTGHLVQIVAIDGEQAVLRDVTLPERPFEARKRHLARAFEATQPLAQVQRIEFVAQNAEAPIGDGREAQAETIDSLQSVYRTLLTIRNDEHLATFGFITEWPSLPRERRLALYSEYACHELHFFLFRKDRAFFDEVVAPALRNKREKTFLDRWLLGQDLREFLQPWDFSQLTLIEQILLAQRLEGAQRATVARMVKDRLELRPQRVEELEALLHAALRSERFGDDDGVRLRFAADPSAMPAEPEAGKESAFDSNQWNSAVGMGGGAGGIYGGRADRGAGSADRAKKLKDEQQNQAGQPAQTGSDDFYLGATRKADAPEELERAVEQRKQVRQLYRGVDATRLLVERNYWQRRNAESLADAVAPNRFWADFAEAPADRPFA